MEVSNTGNTKPRAMIVEVSSAGQNWPATDKGYRNTSDNALYRVRFEFLTDLQDTPSGTASTLITVGRLTITRLNEDFTTVKDANGQAVIVADPLSITLDNAALSATGGETVTQIVQRTLEETVYEASRMMTGQRELNALLNSWGATVGTGVIASVTASSASVAVNLGK